MTALLLVVGAVSVGTALSLVVRNLAAVGDRGSVGARRNLTVGLVDAGQLGGRRRGSFQPGAADLVRRNLPPGLTRSLEAKILRAGSPPAWSLERALAAKTAGAALGAAAGWYWSRHHHGTTTLLLAALVVAVGFQAPDIVIGNRGDKRQALIRRALPDTIDQISISVEAGLGFDGAVARAARSGKGPLADELLRTMQDVQAGLSRPEALRGLAARNDVEELRRFVAAVNQADAYGVPVARVLRTQAAELRVKRRQQAEERAMKIPVKVMIPLVLCILPSMFVVVLGPAVIQVIHSFSKAHF